MNDKRPCALLMNDIHVSKDNIPEFKLNWDEALKVCADNDVSSLIIGGDLWQSRSSQTLNVLIAVRNALILATNAGLEVTIAEGNHCKIDQESIIGYSHLFDKYPNVYVVDDYDSLSFGEHLVLHVMSYFPETGSFKSKLKELIASIKKTDTNILYCHEGIQGALGGMILDSELPQNIFTPFDRVLVGHYHNRCVIDGTNIEYIGASRQHNFGEDEEKGYTLLYDDGSYKFIKNQVNQRYMVLSITAQQINSKLIDRLDEIKADGRYKAKLKISCTSSEAAHIDKQKLLDAGASNVTVTSDETKNKDIDSSSLDKKYDKNGVKTEYTMFCKEKEIKDVDFGLKYLDKIN